MSELRERLKLTQHSQPTLRVVPLATKGGNKALWKESISQGNPENPEFPSLPAHPETHLKMSALLD